jgi:hypothetical protein
MSPDIAALWISGASLVLQAVSMIPRDAKRRTAEDEAALQAVSEAYHATRAFYAATTKTQRDSGATWALAQKWEQAAILLQKYDSTLAKRLDAKSNFWREGGTWSEEEIKQADIGLEKIKTEVDARLTKKG